MFAFYCVHCVAVLLQLVNTSAISYNVLYGCILYLESGMVLDDIHIISFNCDATEAESTFSKLSGIADSDWIYIAFCKALGFCRRLPHAIRIPIMSK